MSFLEQKKKILEQQQELQRQKQQNKNNNFSYSSLPQFNRPQTAAPPHVQPQSQKSQSSYPPVYYPTTPSRYSFNQWFASLNSSYNI